MKFLGPISAQLLHLHIFSGLSGAVACCLDASIEVVPSWTDCTALCRVLLDSFISTQKLSVQKTLQRKFKRFVSYKRDFQELLLSALQGLVREQIRYEACSGAASASEPVVSVPMK